MKRREAYEEEYANQPAKHKAPISKLLTSRLATTLKVRQAENQKLRTENESLKIEMEKLKLSINKRATLVTERTAADI